jgi:LAS superfamily LD-carboxypeptidase LdcB
MFAGVAAFGQYGSAFVERGRYQRMADLSAVAAAQSMRRDYPRLFMPPVLPDGTPNPEYMSRAEYTTRARASARQAAAVNHALNRLRSVSFDRAPAPASVTVSISGSHHVDVPFAKSAQGNAVQLRAQAKAQLAFAVGSLPGPMPAVASGGGYGGQLAYRQGKPMRPDVAAAFDDMRAAAAKAGYSLTVNSGFRSDAEQARLFAAHPDPKWVAPPGTSLHRYGTELDLGPPGAYAWLASNAHSFGFIKRYSWEPWHFGFGANPRDVPAQYERGSFEPPHGRYDGPHGLPAFVPTRFAAMISDAAQRWDVQPELLAAQLQAESGFNPSSVSPTGAQGIAQFMPGTAASIALKDPFDPRQAIDAQAHLMSELIRQFGSIPKALAAYNAGPGAVIKYGGVPPFAETQAYVARILGMIKGGGSALNDPAFAGIDVVAKVVLVR